MALWKASNLLDMVQELIGATPGGFYNIRQRLLYLSQAQREMVDEAHALLTDATVVTTSGQPGYTMPTGFLKFGTRRPSIVHGTSTHPIEVVAPIFLDQIMGGWRDGTTGGTPRYLVQDGSNIYLYPTPNASVTLSFNYVPDPDPLEDMDDVPFNGDSTLNRYGPALAYKAAAVYTLPRAPALGATFEDLYIREEKKMRHFVRSNPQKPQRIYILARPLSGASVGINDGQGPIGGGSSFGGIVYGGADVTYGSGPTVYD